MSKQTVSIGRIVTVRDRSKPAGYQIVPAIVTAVHGDDNVISATGFPIGGTTYPFSSIVEVDPADDETLGWYWPEKV